MTVQDMERDMEEGQVFWLDLRRTDFTQQSLVAQDMDCTGAVPARWALWLVGATTATVRNMKMLRLLTS